MDRLLDLVFPPICLTCATEGHWWCQTEQAPWPVCLTCNLPYQFIKSTESRCQHKQPLLALGHYDGQLRKAIHQLKYDGYWAVSRDWATLLASQLSPLVNPTDRLVPVPLHWTRQIRRGYNQAEILSRYLSLATNLSVEQPLIRYRATRPQIEVETNERANNIRNCFRLNNKNQPGQIWLVDDIATSGATLREASRTLCSGGWTVRGAVVIGLAR